MVFFWDGGGKFGYMDVQHIRVEVVFTKRSLVLQEKGVWTRKKYT